MAKKQVSVSLEEDVIQWLDEVATTEERTRSQVMARIIQKEMERVEDVQV